MKLLKILIVILFLVSIEISPLYSKMTKLEKYLVRFKDELISLSSGYKKEEKYNKNIKNFISDFLKIAEDGELSKIEMDSVTLSYAELIDKLHIDRSVNCDVELKRVLIYLKVPIKNIDYFFTMRDHYLKLIKEKKSMNNTPSGILMKYSRNSGVINNNKLFINNRGMKLSKKIKGNEVENILKKYYPCEENKKKKRKKEINKKKKKIEVNKTLDSIFSQ